MGSFFEGFVTGFSNELARGINERSQIARDYFQKQYELATTVGIENQKKIEGQVQESTKLAKQLQQMGVPRDIIMAVAAQDPLALDGFYKDVAEAQASGIVTDQEFFNDFVTVSKDFKAPDESFETFFNRALKPMSLTAQRDPEGFRKDQKNNIFASMMVKDPYGRANQRLEDEIVIGDMSAKDLLSYTSGYTPSGTEGAPTVSYDYSAVNARTKKPDNLSVAEIKSITDDLTETTNNIWVKKKGSTGRGPDDATTNEAIDVLKEKYKDVPGVPEWLEARRPTAETSVPVNETPSELDDLGIDTTPAPAGPEMPQEGPPTEAPLEGVPPPEEAPVQPAPEAAPTAVAPSKAPAVETDNSPIQPEQEGLMYIIIKGNRLSWYSNNEDGTVTYVDEAGQDYVFDPGEVRQFVKEFGNDYK